MLKMMGVGEKNGREFKFIMFGLSHRNLDLLRQGRPLRIDGASVGLQDVEFMIFAGKDERSMQRDFADLVGAHTTVDIDPRFKD